MNLHTVLTDVYFIRYDNFIQTGFFGTIWLQ